MFDESAQRAAELAAVVTAGREPDPELAELKPLRQDRPLIPQIDLVDALLCCECDAIVAAPANQCPRCTSSVFLRLARIIEPRVPRKMEE